MWFVCNFWHVNFFSLTFQLLMHESNIIMFIIYSNNAFRTKSVCPHQYSKFCPLLRICWEETPSHFSTTLWLLSVWFILVMIWLFYHISTESHGSEKVIGIQFAIRPEAWIFNGHVVFFLAPYIFLCRYPLHQGNLLKWTSSKKNVCYHLTSRSV